MRMGILGTIVALVAGATTAWGQAPMPIGAAGGAPPAVMAGDVVRSSGQNPLLMPPLSVGPQNDPLGLGPTASIGPPPGPMYPTPGPYAEQLWQPDPAGAMGGAGAYSVPRWEIWGGYTLFFNRDQHVPIPLLTTGAPNQGGVLGAPSTLILAGDQSFNYGAFSGMQMGGLIWGDDDRRFGFMTSMLYTENQNISYKYAMTGNGSGGAGSAGIPILSRPFIDSTYGDSSLVFGGPNIGAASAAVSSSSQTWGIDAAGVWNLYRTAPSEKWYWSTDLIVGYKFAELRENVAVSTNTAVSGMTTTPVISISPTTGFPITSGFTTTPVSVPVGGVTVTAPGTINVEDRFTTTNLFNGTTIGLRNELLYGMFSLDATAKISLGNMQQIVEIQGYTYVSNTTTISRTGNVGTAYGGLLANSSNIGRYSHDDFAVIPEGSINLGVNIWRGLTGYVGVTYLYMDHVVRPGDQINPVVNTASVPLSANYGSNGTNAVQGLRFNQSDYWLMGINFGLTYRY